MKRLANLKFMVMAMFVAMLSMSLTACSDDDDDNNGSSSLVGTWVMNGGYINNKAVETLTLTFAANGKGTFYVIYKDGKDGEYKFDYTTTIDGDNDLMLKIVWTSNLSLIYSDGTPYYPTITSSRLIWGGYTYVRK